MRNLANLDGTVTTAIPAYIIEIEEKPTHIYDDLGRFQSYYGNLEATFSRTSFSIDTTDHALDVVADADRKWQWKDEAEFDKRLEIGLNTPAHHKNIRKARLDLINRLENNLFPFDQGWERWICPENLSLPSLPTNWNLVE